VPLGVDLGKERIQLLIRLEEIIACLTPRGRYSTVATPRGQERLLGPMPQ
jgi:hypothetical protein